MEIFDPLRTVLGEQGSIHSVKGASKALTNDVRRRRFKSAQIEVQALHRTPVVLGLS